MKIEKNYIKEINEEYLGIIKQSQFLLENNKEYKNNNDRMREIRETNNLGEIIDGEISRSLNEEESKMLSEYIHILLENEIILNKQLLISGIKSERNFRKIINNKD